MSASPARPAGPCCLSFPHARAAPCVFKPSCRLSPARGPQFPFVRAASVSAWVSQTPSQEREVAPAAPLCFLAGKAMESHCCRSALFRNHYGAQLDHFSPECVLCVLLRAPSLVPAAAVGTGRMGAGLSVGAPVGLPAACAGTAPCVPSGVSEGRVRPPPGGKAGPSARLLTAVCSLWAPGLWSPQQ